MSYMSEIDLAAKSGLKTICLRVHTRRWKHICTECLMLSSVKANIRHTTDCSQHPDNLTFAKELRQNRKSHVASKQPLEVECRGCKEVCECDDLGLCPTCSYRLGV